MEPRIYLDNAATSWPKPEAVYEAVDHYQRNLGAPNGRSGYREAVEANRIVERARLGIARLIGATAPKEVIFTASGTDSLNMAIQGIVRPGDHVVTTVCDHNSVLRPLTALKETANVSVTYVPCDSQGFVSPEDVQKALRPETSLVAVIHGSNVTGAIQPVAEIGAAVNNHPALLLVDAAQTLGHFPIDVDALGIDLLAAPGHKGLMGPLGTGILYICPGVEEKLLPFRLGGTGTRSEEDRQPEMLPDKYEPGNHNLPGLAGLAAAVDWLESQSVEQIHAHLATLTVRLLKGLKAIPGVEIAGPPTEARRTSVVSFRIVGYDPQEVASALEATHGVQGRPGLHCAPRMHEALQTLDGGGTMRLSPGWFTTVEDIDRTCEAIATLAMVATH